MRYKKILLVNPPYSGTRFRVVFSTGLGYIAEMLKNSGLDYDVLDMSLGYRYKHLKKQIEDFRPDLIGISIMTFKYKETYSILDRTKKDFPEIDIIAGGSHISLFREKVLSDCPQIDYGIVLEGEGTVIELCKGGSVESIKGLIFRNEDGAIYNGDRPFIENLDAIPFPKYEKFELERSINKEVNTLNIGSSRGCPFECIFCAVENIMGKVFRVRSPENILEELTYWHERGYRRFNFTDDNFTLIKERVYKLCDLIKKGNLEDLKLSCDNGLRADRVDRDLLNFMREAGFYRFAIGVEAGNNKVLRSLKKGEDIETIKRVIKDACSLGYEVNLFFLVGSPGETWQDLKDSFKIVLDYPISTVNFSNIIPYPHTELFSWVKKKGRFLKDPEDYFNNCPVLDNEPIFETADMTKRERKKALKYALALNRITLRRSLQRKLAHLGVLGKLIAFIFTAKIMQDIVIRKKFFAKIIYRLSDFCF